jgi:hypothetical protein
LCVHVVCGVWSVVCCCVFCGVCGMCLLLLVMQVGLLCWVHACLRSH